MALGIFHSDEKEWYEKGQVKKLYDFYKGILDSFSLPGSLVLTKCCQCHIEFPTSSSNRGRTDVRCPFGCRQQHKKKKSNDRSKAYYQTPEGKIKKQEQNRKRKARPQEEAEQKPETIPPGIFDFLTMLLTSIVGLEVKMSELKALIMKALKNLRQHPLELLSKTITLAGYD